MHIIFRKVLQQNAKNVIKGGYFIQNKIHKQIGALFLSLVLCLTLLPMSVLAYDYPSQAIENLSIGKAEITEKTYYIVSDGTVTSDGASADDYNVYYDNTTLTLNNAKLASAIYVPGGTTIELIGENVSGSEDKKVSIGIQAFSSGSITITGSGSYEVYTDYEGIATVYGNTDSPNGDIFIEGGTIDMHGAPISTRYGGITISGNADVNAGAISTGGNPNDEEAQRARDIIIQGNAKVRAEEISNLQKIILRGNAVVEVVNPSGMAVSGNRGIEISGNAKVIAAGTTGGLNAFSGPITINSTNQTSVTVTTDRCAAISVGQGDGSPLYMLTINSDVAVAGSVGIGSTQGDIVIDGGNVTANVTYIGFANSTSSSDQASIIIKDSIVDIGGSAQAGLNTKGTITVENSTVTVRGNVYSFYSMPVLQFDETYRVTAGDDADSATVVPNDTLNSSAFQKKYVKIEPAEIIKVNAIHLSQKAISLNVGNTVDLTYTIEPDTATDKTVVWSSDNDTIATVDSNGKVNAVSSGTATITVTTVDGGKTATCAVTVYRESSAGSDDSDPTYSVTLPKNVEGGEVKTSHRYAEQGSTVTITVKPDSGYELDELTVTDSKGRELDLTNKGAGKYTFKMPGTRVEVEVSFKLIETEPEAPAFADVPASAYYADAVAWAVEQGITSGTSATTFSPNMSCTRAQIVTFLWRANGSPKADGANPFADVSADAYYYDAVLWAVEKGITSGTSATTFSPDATVTRGQTVTFLYRAAGAPAVSGGSFADVAADAYYADAVSWAVKEGITSGTGVNSFSPDAPCTRGQIVTFMYRGVQ